MAQDDRELVELVGNRMTVRQKDLIPLLEKRTFLEEDNISDAITEGRLTAAVAHGA